MEKKLSNNKYKSVNTFMGHLQQLRTNNNFSSSVKQHSLLKSTLFFKLTIDTLKNVFFLVFGFFLPILDAASDVKLSSYN